MSDKETAPSREVCKHCGLQIYLSNDCPLSSHWKHHGSNLRECYISFAEPVAAECTAPQTAEILASLKEFLALRQACIDVGGTEGPLDQELITRLAEMQTGVVDRAEAAITEFEAAVSPQVTPSPILTGKLEHGRNCGALGFDGYDAGECTCGLEWRIALQTEQTMHAAWRKRAEEAETKLAEVTSGQASEVTSEKWKRVDLQLVEDALFIAQAVDADKDRAERMRLTGEMIHKLIKSEVTSGQASQVTPSPAGVKGEDFWIDELEYQIGRKVNRNYLRTWLRAFAANLKSAELTSGQAEAPTLAPPDPDYVCGAAFCDDPACLTHRHSSVATQKVEAPTPETCPTCGSDKREERLPVQYDGYFDEDCRDKWHFSVATQKGKGK